MYTLMFFCSETLAVQLISWLQWHLPPTLLPVPHKQIKCLYLSPSRLHFTLMTLHLYLSFVSLTPTPSLPWQSPVLSFICKYSYGLGRKKKGNKNSFSSYHKINIGHHLVSFPLLYPIVLPWLDMASRESGTCCLQSRVKRWRGQGAQRGSWWEMGQGWILAGKGIRKELQGKINTNKVQAEVQQVLP